MYYVTTSITQGICLTTHHTQKMHAYIHVLVWYSIRINEMGFDDAYIKKNIMLLKNIYRKVHVGIWTYQSEHCLSSVYILLFWTTWQATEYIYMCHTLLEIYLAFVWYQMIRYTHAYISCAHGWFDSRHASYIILSLII